MEFELYPRAPTIQTPGTMAGGSDIEEQEGPELPAETDMNIPAVRTLFTATFKELEEQPSWGVHP
jgi:hypothetical protein